MIAKIDILGPSTKKNRRIIGDRRAKSGIPRRQEQKEHPLHPAGQEELLSELKSWRIEKAKKTKFPPYYICSDSVLGQIAVTLPKNKEELMQIKNLGKKTIDKYGDEILSVIQKFIQKYN